MSARHVLNILMVRQPDSLVRIASLLVRRRYVLESITQGLSELSGFCRLTLVLKIERKALAQLTRQLERLFPVIREVTEMNAENGLERELLLLKVSAGESPLSSLAATLKGIHARVLESTSTDAIVEICEDAEQTRSLAERLKSYSIKSISRSGVVALSR